MGGRITRLLIGIAFLLLSGSTVEQRPFESPGKYDHIQITWNWEDPFSSIEKQKIKDWLISVTHAVESTLGRYPFDLDFYLYRRNNSREPVPWAHTERYDGQGVHFYVDPSYSTGDFLDDWTAPHEISHLSLPYLGRQQAWFAEGYASYMQYQVMEQLGICSKTQMQSRYEAKLKNVISFYQKDQDMISIARNLQKSHRYPQMYWGSATFFMSLDAILVKEFDTSLLQLIKEYQECCRLNDDTLEELLDSWDGILGEPVCRDLLYKYQTAPAREIIKVFQDRL